jgi:hypothetical protein
MNRYHDKVKEAAEKVLAECAESFRNDAEEHGGTSKVPNVALWLDRTGVLSKHVEALTKSWTMKDFLWVNEHTRHRVAFGDPKDNAFGAFYKDILLELKKLMRKA